MIQAVQVQTRQQIEASIQPPRPGGCTRDTPRCPDARDYHADLRPCCRSHIREIVAEVAPLLVEHGIIFWADYGTLLGAVRNPLLGLPAGIISHDKDADFGMLAADMSRLFQIRTPLEAKGYHVIIKPEGRSMKVRLSAKNHTNVDFFNWFERSNGELYRKRYIQVDQFKGRDFHKDAAFPLTTVEWEGLTLPAPRDPAAFCEFRYGPTWMTPIHANHDGRRR